VLVPLSWLCDFAPFDADPTRLAETLDDLGLVVESVKHVGQGLGDVVVARVLEIAAIAGADKIRQVTVDAGAGPLSVVCGAWNFAVDDLVPLAPVGAVLPGDFAIARRKMKGVTSNGMLCSGRELELTDDHDGILVLGHLGDAGAPSPGERFVDALGIVADVVFDVAVEANRPDAWCMAGWPATWPPVCACLSPCPTHRSRRSPPPPGQRRGSWWWTTICAPASPPACSPASRSVPRPTWSPAGSPWPACGPSTTSSTPPTT